MRFRLNTNSGTERQFAVASFRASGGRRLNDRAGYETEFWPDCHSPSAICPATREEEEIRRGSSKTRAKRPPSAGELWAGNGLAMGQSWASNGIVMGYLGRVIGEFFGMSDCPNTLSAKEMRQNGPAQAGFVHRAWTSIATPACGGCRDSV